jgi:hypothetical protein
MWYETPVPRSLQEVNDAIRKVAEKRCPFFDALDPPLLTKELMHANLSAPSDEGQSVVADKIAAWLRTRSSDDEDALVDVAAIALAIAIFVGILAFLARESQTVGDDRLTERTTTNRCRPAWRCASAIHTPRGGSAEMSYAWRLSR